MKIKTLIYHPKGSMIELPGARYVPVLQPDGAQVFEVNDAAHIERLLAIKEGFAPYDPDAVVPVQEGVRVVPAMAGSVFLAGSSVHPASFDIGGRFFTLGDVVTMAHKASGLRADEWNDALTADERHNAIDAELDRLQAAAEVSKGSGQAAAADAMPDFATMKVPELLAYAAEHLPDATINPKTPTTTLRKLVHKLVVAKAEASQAGA